MGFDWLDKLFDLAITLLPQFKIVTPDEALVEFPWGCKPRCFKPKPKSRMYFIWGILARTETVALEEVPLDLRQDIVSADNVAIAIRTHLSYCIRDPVRALISTSDCEGTLSGMARILIKDAASYVDASEIYMSEELEEKILKRLRRGARKYGIGITCLGITHATPCRTYTLNGIGNNE